MERLFIRLIEIANHALMAEWALYQNNQKIADDSIPCPITELGNAVPVANHQARAITLFVPAIHVLHTSADIPAKQAKHAARIVPHLIEDKLADQIQDYHIAYDHKRLQDGSIEALAVNKQKFSEWLYALEECGLSPDEVFSELQLLPAGEEKIYVLQDSLTCWIRSGKHVALCTDATSSASVISHIQQQLAMSPAQIEYVGASSTNVCEYLVNQYLSSGDTHLTNMLQGSFAQAARANSRHIVKQLAAIATVWLLGMLAINAAQLAYYYYESGSHRERSLNLYKQLFPADSRIINPRKQMETHLSANASASTGFLSILNKVSPSTGSLAASVENLTYQQDTKLLTLAFQSKNMESINQLTQQLQNSDIDAKIQSVINTASGITAVLEVRERAP